MSVPTTVQKATKVVPVATLRVGDAGPAIPITHEEGTLGRRSDNAYVVSDPRVSRVHASIRRSSAGVVIVTDLGSGGGTSVNGERINGPTVLTHGDEVGFGPVTARFEDPANPSIDDDETQNFALPKVETGARPSPRQQQVLEGIAEGLTNLEIGERLGVTERTVKAYASELYEKLGVHNRAGAVSEAIRQGLLQGGPDSLHPAPTSPRRDPYDAQPRYYSR